MFDVEKIRQDFPILQREVHPGKKIVYLDSAATSQKPISVINAMDDYYRFSNANIHRGVHRLAEEATEMYEMARTKISKFINSEKTKQVIFTRNTTESINLVAQTWGRKNLKANDLIVLSQMEHHSNIVPWQMLSSQIGFSIEFIKVTPEGILDEEHFLELLKKSPKLVSFTQMSNVLGTINPVKKWLNLHTNMVRSPWSTAHNRCHILKWMCKISIRIS